MQHVSNPKHSPCTVLVLQIILRRGAGSTLHFYALVCEDTYQGIENTFAIFFALIFNLSFKDYFL